MEGAVDAETMMKGAADVPEETDVRRIVHLKECMLIYFQF